MMKFPFILETFSSKESDQIFLLQLGFFLLFTINVVRPKLSFDNSSHAKSTLNAFFHRQRNRGAELFFNSLLLETINWLCNLYT